MAVIEQHVSDLTRQPGEASEFGALEVLHPDFREPIRLEVLPSEVEGRLKTADRMVEVRYSAPGARLPERYVIPLEDFSALAKGRDMNAILSEAHAATQAQRGRPTADGRKPAAAGGVRTKINYASLEHAGEPHRGKITEAERDLVRDNLDQINARLAAAGMRPIDPADPKMQERYGL